MKRILMGIVAIVFCVPMMLAKGGMYILADSYMAVVITGAKEFIEIKKTTFAASQKYV